MGIKMDLEQSQAQAESIATMCQAQIEAYQNLQRVIKNFASDTESLQGKAYQAARDYYESILLPLAQGGELYAELLAKASHKLPEEYQEKVDTKSWNEDQLLDYIQQENLLIADLEVFHDSLSRLTFPSGHKEELLHHSLEMIRGHQMNRQIYEKILEDLRSYDRYSPSLFDELEDIALQMSRGLAQAENSWNLTTNTFTLPQNLSWAHQLSAYRATKDLALTKIDKIFIQSMMSEYGFDVLTAQQLLTLKKGLEGRFSIYFDRYTQKELDYLFLRLVGAASYDDLKWDETAGSLGKYFSQEVKVDFVTGEPLRVAKPLLDIYQELGLSKQEAKQLRYHLRLQHEMAGGRYRTSKYIRNTNHEFYENLKNNYKLAYGASSDFDTFWDERLKAYSNHGTGNPDFTHQSITMATHLNPASFQLSDFYGGREHIKALAGWEGDTTYNASDRAPSIGEDDYKADLDAVNIIGRMNKGQSYDTAMSSYYCAVHQDEKVREKEFLQNEDWKQVKQKIYRSLLPDRIIAQGDEVIREHIAKHYKDVSQFIERLAEVAE